MTRVDGSSRNSSYYLSPKLHQNSVQRLQKQNGPQKNLELQIVNNRRGTKLISNKIMKVTLRNEQIKFFKKGRFQRRSRLFTKVAIDNDNEN